MDMNKPSVLQHLATRKFDVNKHRVWIDEENRVATYPLLNTSGQMCGYQQYRPEGDKKAFNSPREGKYYSHRNKTQHAVWGLESWRFSNTLFVTEGVFDASRLTWVGCSAVAVLANDLDKSLTRWLWTVRRFRKIVTVCDDDKAGRKLQKFGNTFHVVEDGDLGDASDEYVENLVKKYT